MNKGITIKDIAKELGIHHATVSRALKEAKTVKKETRDLILKKAKEMGYTPNLLAQNFRNNRSNVIAVIVPDLKHHFFSRFISDITHIAQNDGFVIMVFQSHDNPTFEKEIISSLIQMRVAGVAASIGLYTESYSHYDELKYANIPLVFFDRTPSKTQFSSVVSNNYTGTLTAVDELIKRGRKKIAYISFESHINVFNDRLRGYIDAINQSGLNYRKLFNVKQMFIKDGYEITSILLKEDNRPDAIICVNDEVAIGVIKYLRKHNYSVPEQISVIGFDDNPMSIVCEPELTTLSQSTEILSGKTLELLLKEIYDKETIKEEVILPMQLQERDSF